MDKDYINSDDFYYDDEEKNIYLVIDSIEEFKLNEEE